MNLFLLQEARFESYYKIHDLIPLLSVLPSWAGKNSQQVVILSNAKYFDEQ
jgi:hypothetical protein